MEGQSIPGAIANPTCAESQAKLSPLTLFLRALVCAFDELEAKLMLAKTEAISFMLRSEASATVHYHPRKHNNAVGRLENALPSASVIRSRRLLKFGTLSRDGLLSSRR